MIKRRAFLSSVSAIALFATPASAILFSGASSGGGGSAQITTLTMNNSSGSSETPMWSKVFGLAFPDSDTTGCPLSGSNPTYPEFKVGSTVIPYSMSVRPSYWPSGRLMHATFCLVYGTNLTVANGANGTVNVYQSSNTSLPSASSRAQSDFSTADLKHLVTGLDNVSGNYESNLNDGVTDALSDNYVWLDGPAGKMWRIRARYKQSGTPEGNLEGYWYVMSMQDSSGNFGGIRFALGMAVPFGDASASLRTMKSFSAMTLQTGSTVIRDNVTSGRTNQYNFTWTSGANLNAASNVFESAQLARLTTTGTLPAGLSTGTSYYIYNNDFYTPPYSTFQLQPGPFAQGGNSITPTDAGTGTHTATTYPWLSCYSKIWMNGTTADWDFVQGGGSFTPPSTYIDTNLQTRFSNTYLRSTKVYFPSMDFTPTVTAGALTPFYINGTCGLYKQPSGSGLNDDHIGIISGYYARHLYTQSLNDQINTMAIGLTGGQYGCTLRVSGNGGTVPAWNRGTNGSGTPYTGLGTLLYNQRFYPPSSVTIYAANSTSDYNNQIGPLARGGQCADFSHRMQFFQYPYLISGRPEYLDMMIEQAALAVGAGYNSGTVTAIVDGTQFAPNGGFGSGSAAGGRNVLDPDGTTRYGVGLLGGQARGDAWYFAYASFLAAILPVQYPEQNAAYKQYFTDIVDTAFGHTIACVNAMFALNSYADTIKAWHPQIGSYIEDLWQNSGYMLQAMSVYYGMSGNTNCATVTNWILTHLAYIVNTFGINMIGGEENLILGSNGPGSAGMGWPITSDLGHGFHGVQVTAWTSGSADFTINLSSTGWTPAVNDRLIFTSPNIASETQTPIPNALTAFQPYYIVSVSGSGSTRTVQLSATLGGSAISNTDSKTNNIYVWYCPVSPITTLGYSNSITAYPTLIGRAVYMAKSRGFTIDSSLEAAIDGAIPAATTGNFGSNPIYCFGKTA